MIAQYTGQYVWKTSTVVEDEKFRQAIEWLVEFLAFIVEN